MPLPPRFILDHVIIPLSHAERKDLRKNSEQHQPPPNSAADVWTVSFRILWLPPERDCGKPVTSYTVQIKQASQVFEIYRGPGNKLPPEVAAQISKPSASILSCLVNPITFPSLSPATTYQCR